MHHSFLSLRDAKEREKEWNLSRNVHVRGVESMSLQNWKCKAVNKMVLRNLPTLPTYLFYRSRRILFSGRIEKPSSLFLVLKVSSSIPLETNVFVKPGSYVHSKAVIKIK